MECLVSFISDISASDNPAGLLRLLVKTLEDDIFTLAPSTKHMADKDLGRLEPTPALKYKVAA